MAVDEAKPQPEAEAVRLKTLAEQKYSSGDLKSALKYAKRAYSLHSAADGVSEMLTAFKILQNSTVPAATAVAAVGNGATTTTTTSALPDYYKILQTERFSHINTIKTQYRKLALALHPDKNPFAASEEAFKVVGEAFRVLSDKIRRKEYDVKLRVAMQSAVTMAESGGDEQTTSFWTSCSSCRILHQFDKKYLGHNLMCPSCKKSFEAIEVSENGENIEVSDGLMEKRVSARNKARKNVSFGSSRNRELVGKRKVGGVGEVSKRSSGKTMRNVDAIGVGNEVVRNVDVENDDDGLIKGLRSRSNGKVRKVARGVDAIGDGNEVVRNVDVESDDDDGLIKGLRSRSSGKVRKVARGVDAIKDGNEVVRDVDMEGDVESDDGLIKGLRSRTNGKARKMRRNVDVIGVGNEAVREKRAVEVRDVDMEGGDVESDDGLIKGLRSRTNDKARNVGEGEDTMTLAEMQLLVKKKVHKEKIPIKDKGEDDVEMETLIARVREKRMKREALKGDGSEDGGRRSKNLSSKRCGKGLRQDESEIIAENGKKEKAITVNLTEKESEKRKETSLSLIEEEDEVEMETLIARVRDRRMRREALKGDGLEDGGRRDLSSNRGGKGLRQDDSEIMAENGKEENEKAMTFNLTEKGREKSKEMNSSMREAEDEVEMETLIARVKEKRMRREASKGDSLENGGRGKRDLSSKRCGKGSRQDDTEIMTENEKTMGLNLTEKQSEERKETNLNLIEDEDEDEVEMELPITRLREKRMRRVALKADGFEHAERKRDLSTLSKSSKKGKGPRRDDSEIVAAESFDLYNFDKDRVARSFKKGQVWAVYDDDDGMPRDYALIDDVISLHPFEVRLNRLELQNNSDQALLHWGERGFHISCGKFKVSSQALVKSLKKFSHVVDSERAARELYRIYPSKGSIWAVYKENALGVEDNLCYDIVVSLSSYTDMHGVSIAYLERVDEFRTIFKRREVGARAVKLLRKDELRLFSHRIPARKLSDEEASNISKYCWELDPAALPHTINRQS